MFVGVGRGDCVERGQEYGKQSRAVGAIERTQLVVLPAKLGVLDQRKVEADTQLGRVVPLGPLVHPHILRNGPGVTKRTLTPSERKIAFPGGYSTSPRCPRLLWSAVARLSRQRLEALIEQATVDAYDEYEQLSGFHVMLEDHLATPFQTTVPGVEVTIKKIDLRPGSGIVAICTRGPHRQPIGILDLPLPDPPPEGSEWIDAYRHWAT